MVDVLDADLDESETSLDLVHTEDEPIGRVRGMYPCCHPPCGGVTMQPTAEHAGRVAGADGRGSVGGVYPGRVHPGTLPSYHILYIGLAGGRGPGKTDVGPGKPALHLTNY